MTIPLSEKYRPEKFSDIKGQELAIDKIKAYVKAFSSGFLKKKAILLHGPAGTGKTTLAHVFSKELGYEIFELNASDLRNRLKLDEVLKPSTLQKSLFAKGKIILVDEVDGVTSTEYGGVAELIVLIEKSKFPVIITGNNIWQSKFSLLRQKCELIALKELTYPIVLELLEVISKKERKDISLNILKEIAAKSRGDLRAALNDLQSIMHLTKEEQEEKALELDLREKSQSIFESLREIFKSRPNENTLEAFDNVDLEMDQIKLWLEENIPKEYHGEDLARAFDALSKADIFKGRIHRQQYWRFMAYENFFMTAGISSAKGYKTLADKFTKYDPPKRILKIWMMNQKNLKKKTISAKFAELTHISKKRAERDFFLISLITDKETIKQLNLSEEEQEYLEQNQLAIRQEFFSKKTL